MGVSSDVDMSKVTAEAVCKYDVRSSRDEAHCSSI